MKRIILITLLLVCSLSLFASPSPSPAFAFSRVGEKCADSSFGALSFSAGLLPFGKADGRLYTELSLLVGFDKPLFRGVDCAIYYPIIRVANDFFSYAFSNTVIYEPSVALITQYRRDGLLSFGFALSPLKFSDMSFCYELFSPYLSFSTKGEKSYGIRIIKITAFL